jgi:hypothetical protein
LAAGKLADLLKNKGLRFVGVLNVDSCLAGAKTLLEDLGTALDAKRIHFGWIAGSRKEAADLRNDAKVGDQHFNWSPLGLSWKRSAGIALPASLNRKVLRGNDPADFDGTVFDSEKSPLPIASKYSPLR